MKLTCLAWLVAIGSTGVAKEMPPIGCDGDSDSGSGMGGDDCEVQAAAMNKLDGIDDVICGGYYPFLYLGSYKRCLEVAAILNRLIGQPVKNASNIICESEFFFLASPDADKNNDDCTKLTALLQGPTCKHGTSIPGPPGGGNCTGPCETGWEGKNCDVLPLCPNATWHSSQCTTLNNCSSSAPYKCVDGAAIGACQATPWPKNSSCSGCFDLSNCNCNNSNHGAKDSYGHTCADYFPSHGGPGSCSVTAYNTPTFNGQTMCCACGGGDRW